MQSAGANSRILAGDDHLLDMTETGNDFKMKWESDEGKFHRMAKGNDLLEMWQGSQILPSTLIGSRAQNNQITAVGYISET